MDRTIHLLMRHVSLYWSLMHSKVGLCDCSIGNLTGEELRRICQEAIARGQTYERARKRCWKYVMLAVTLAGTVSAVTLGLYR